MGLGPWFPCFWGPTLNPKLHSLKNPKRLDPKPPFRTAARIVAEAGEFRQHCGFTKSRSLWGLGLGLALQLKFRRIGFRVYGTIWDRRVYIGVIFGIMENRMETTGIIRNYIGIIG